MAFFTKQETASESRPDGKVYSCISCAGYQNCQSPKMAPQGEGKKGIMIIGPGITALDDKRGLQFQGSLGKKLQRAFQKFDVDLFEDCILLNVTKCLFTDEDDDERNPTNYEIQCCRKYVLAAIKIHKPQIIILIGQEAVYSMIGNRWKKDLGKINKWRGWTIPDQDFKCWICPIENPIYIDSDKKPELQMIFEQDIERILSKLDAKFPLYVEPEIIYLDELSPLIEIASKWHTHKEIAFDYETTGLKPHAEGHRIVCASIAISENEVYTFMMPKKKKDREPFTSILTDLRIGKIAQNMKFEDTWTAVRLGIEVRNWTWDTMLATHILDNRPDITSLKFQVYVQFGVIDYDSEISPYLKSVQEKNSNSINKVDELLAKPNGQHKLLKYCALDSIFEYRLAQLQQEFILPF